MEIVGGRLTRTAVEAREAKRALEALSSALGEVPDPPCVTCKHEATCKALEFACLAFGKYVNRQGHWGNRGQWRNVGLRTPRRDIYLAIMKG